mgnify:CR=1 FL=1
MKWLNHQITTGFIVYAATNDALAVAASIAGAVIPDKIEGAPPKESKAYWKWRRSHRALSHYPPLYIFLLALAQGVNFYFQNPIAGIICNIVSYILIGALLHIAEDGICGKIPIFSTKKKHGLKLFKVGSWQENFFTLLIICVCVAFSFREILNLEINLNSLTQNAQTFNITEIGEKIKNIFAKLNF